MTRFLILLISGLFLMGALAMPSWAADEGFGGVGLQVVPTINGDLVVLNVLKDAPAAQKGVQPGDLIFQVDNFSLQGSDFGKVVAEHLWGPVGSKVELFYRRPGVAGVSRVVLERASIDPRMTVTPTVKNGMPGSNGSK